MAFCTAKELVLASQQGRSIAYYDNPDSRYDESIRYERNVDLAMAHKILANTLQRTLNQGQWKINRPYELVNVTEELDQNQAWIGWEIECGWASKEDYEKVVNYIWRYQNHVTIDQEGAGPYPTEITFCPANASDMEEGTAQVHRFLNYINRKNIGKARWLSYNSVGTHMNISTPAFRRAHDDTASKIRSILSQAMARMSQDQKEALFGRPEPYGYAHLNNSQNSGRWLEFKTFNSTLDIEQFNKYVKVALRTAELMEHLASLASIPTYARYAFLENDELLRIWDYHGTTYSTMTNLYEALTGQLPASEVKIVPVLNIHYSNYSREQLDQLALRMADHVYNNLQNSQG